MRVPASMKGCALKMLFKQFNKRPTVSKVSRLINHSSHRQKKYISLMVVPSYSTGKTRTLRVPRVFLHSIIAGMLVITAVVTGFYLRSNYFQRMAQDLDMTLVETETRYNEFRAHAEQVQDDLIEVAAQIYEELNETEHRAQSALDEKAQQHQTELEIILDQIDIIEQQIREFDEDLQAIIGGLSNRGRVIPPVAALVEQLEASQANLRQQSLIHNPPIEEVAAYGIVALGGNASAYVPVDHSSVQEHLQLLVDELAVQRLLMECLEHHRGLMDRYLRNFPTLWPVSGRISSGFGWRRNPFGGRNSEWHSGVDIPARTGTAIRAAGGGVVVFSGWRNGYGNTIIIDHGSGIRTLYAHNSRNLAAVGQQVARGDTIAHVGTTGRTTGAHLHYEVKVNGVAVDPLPFMKEHHS